MIRGIIILSALALSACTGQTQLRLLEADNALRVDRVEHPTHDYVVTMRNVVDINLDLDDKADRDDIALRAMQAQCPAARVVDETVIETGTYLTGRPSRTYAVQIRCKPT